MNIVVRKAQRQKSKLRLALIGASGTGKTYSSLQIAKGLGKKVLLVDTEGGSGELYADLMDYDVAPVSAPFQPKKYIEAIKYAEENAYDVVILDSLSHAWAGEGGLLDQQGAKADQSGNSWTAWRSVTPQHNQLVEAILQSKVHIIATMRAKTEHIQEKDERTGKTVVRKIGLAPVQRDGLEYEFTVVFDIDYNHQVSASKDRTSLFDQRFLKPTPELGKELKNWLEKGIDAIETPKVETVQDLEVEPDEILEGVLEKIELAENIDDLKILKEQNPILIDKQWFLKPLMARYKALSDNEKPTESVDSTIVDDKESEDMSTKFMESLDEPKVDPKQLKKDAEKEVDEATTNEELDEIKAKYEGQLGKDVLFLATIAGKRRELNPEVVVKETKNGKKRD